MVTLNTDEPEATIYSPEWRTAQSRLRHLQAPDLTKILRSIFRHIEEGWSIIRPIQSYHEEDPRRTDLDPVTAAVLYFLEVEVVDRFRGLTIEMIRTVPPTRSAKVSTAAFDDVQSETELIQRYFRLAGLMGRMPEVAGPVRGYAASAGTLEAWAVEFERLFLEVEAVIKRMGLEENGGEDRGGARDE